MRRQILDGVQARAQEIKQESGRLKGKVGIITGVGPEVGIGVSVFTGNKGYVNVVCRQLLLSYFLKKARHPWCRGGLGSMLSDTLCRCRTPLSA